MTEAEFHNVESSQRLANLIPRDPSLISSFLDTPELLSGLAFASADKRLASSKHYGIILFILWKSPRPEHDRNVTGN
jgi:hypothetical protein